MLVPVRIRLMGSNEQSQPAYTLDATENGVRVAGFYGDIKIEDIVEIQHRHNKGLFRVVWVQMPPNSSEKHFGAQCVFDNNIWNESFPEQPDEIEDQDL